MYMLMILETSSRYGWVETAIVSYAMQVQWETGMMSIQGFHFMPASSNACSVAALCALPVLLIRVLSSPMEEA